MPVPFRSDRSLAVPVKRHSPIGARRRQGRESGQAMVEFALILFPLLIVVVGIIQFGIGINYWLDMNRLSNQGARWAVVNAYPGCTRFDSNTLSCGTSTSLQRYIACQRLPSSLKPTVDVSFPSGSSATKFGDPVQVQVSSPYSFRAIMKLATITLTARTTMRIEQDAVRYQAGSFTPTTCP